MKTLVLVLSCCFLFAACENKKVVPATDAAALTDAKATDAKKSVDAKKEASKDAIKAVDTHKDTK